MTRKQLLALMFVEIAAFSGAGFFNLLPIYAGRLGGDPASIGSFLSTVFVAVALGTIIAGWLADRFQKRKLTLIIGGALAVPVIWLMGSATTLSQLVLLNAIGWFVASMALGMVGILGGLFAAENERGRVFGLIGLSVGIGGTIGSFAAGPIVDRWGYQTLFQICALVTIGVPIAGLFVTDKVVPRSQPQKGAAQRPAFLTNRTFLLLFCASAIIHIANSQITLAKPLIMDGLHFDATAVSTAGAIGTLICLPLPFLVGWLSDRLGRKPFIVLCYATQLIGLLMLSTGSILWQFWIISAFQNMVGNSMVAGQALITDIVPQETLGTVLSLFGATPWIGFVIGFTLSGRAMDAFGMTSSLLLGIGISLVAMLLLIPIQKRQPQAVPAA